MNVTIRQLQVFASAAKHLSFARAAEELHLTQPAISMQIKELESAVGLPLFDRAGRKIALTTPDDLVRIARGTEVFNSLYEVFGKKRK